MCAEGQSHINPLDRPVCYVPDDLVGPRCESVLKICGVSARCLLDTGSQVSTVSSRFYQEHLQDATDLLGLDKLLNIEVAGGHQLPYQGAIEVKVRFHKSVTGSSDEIIVPFLVVDDTTFNSEIPVLIGTNVLNYCLKLCKDNQVAKFGSFKLNKCQVSKPWKTAYRCLFSQTAVKCDSSVLLKISASKTVHANSTLDIDCCTNGDAIVPGGDCLVTSDGLTLPGGLIVMPMVVTGDIWKKHLQVRVRNPSQVDVTIPPNTVIGNMETAALASMSVLNNEHTEPDIVDVSELFDLEHLEDLGVSCDEIQRIQQLLNQHRDAISLHDFDLGTAKGYKHTIELIEGAKPFKIPYRRIPPSMWEEVRDHIEKMLSSGVIEPSSSPFASPIVLVRKKDNSLRFVVDYRKLNSLTVKDAFGLPRPQDIFDRLSKAKWFSGLDLKSGYWQLEVDSQSKACTSFTAGPLGFYQFIKMPFGLSNAGASFQRMMESCMGPDNLSCCLLYLDDIIIFSETLDQHIERLDRILSRLQECGLKLNAKKCHLFKSKIRYLGHWITSEGIATDDEKTEAVQNWPAPTSREELRRFLGFASFYRRFILNFASISEPLHQLLRGGKRKRKGVKPTSDTSSLPPFIWGESQQKSFDEIKIALTSAPVLAYADYSKPFVLHTDASTLGLGAVLYQEDDQGRLRVISYASRTLTDAERKYSAFRLEFLALKWSVTEKFADYLRGSKFSVKSDCNPLTYVMSSARLDACGQRWVAELSNYDFDIFYRPGKNNVDADALSRIPAEEWKQLGSSTVKAVCESLVVPDLASSICLTSDCSFLFQIATDFSWDKDSWVEHQKEDTDLQNVVQVLNGEATSGKSVDAKLLLRQKSKLFVADGLLQRRVTMDDEEICQVVVPKSLQNEVLSQLHNKMGHPGVERTFELIRGRFYFSRMNSIIAEYVSKCDRCIRRKTIPQRAPMGRLESSGPMDMLCVDFLALESSKGGYSNILVLTDHYTRYSQAVATKDQTARTTANAIISIFVNHYGMPAQLHSDQGANFEGKVIRQMCEVLGIKKTHTTAYHAQGNSQAEKFNCTLLNMLACLNEEQKTNWKEHLPFLVHAYNCTKNDATGFSPFFLMFGRCPRLPVDIIKGLRETEHDENYVEYVKKMKDKLSSAYKKASEHAAKVQDQNKTYYDRKASATSLEVGDRVLVRKVRFKENPHKIEDRWEDGVFEVVGVPEGKHNVYDVQKYDEKKSKVRRLHRNLLLPIGHISAESTLSKDKPVQEAGKTHQVSQDSSDEDEDEWIPRTSPRLQARSTPRVETFDQRTRTVDQRTTAELSSSGTESADEVDDEVDDIPTPVTVPRVNRPVEVPDRDDVRVPPRPEVVVRLSDAPGEVDVQVPPDPQQNDEVQLRRSTRPRRRPQWQVSGE